MKLSAIGPFTATPAPEVDRSLEAQEIARKGQKTRPISEDEASPSPRDTTDEEAREGFVRLADFLKKQQQKNKGRAKGKSERQKALLAYTYLDDCEMAQSRMGLHFDDSI